MKKAITTKAITTEALWLIGIFIISYVICLFANTGKAVDINNNDTYIIDRSGQKFYTSLRLSCFIVTGFAVYFVRALYFKFQFILIDVILLILTITFLWFLRNILFSFEPYVFNLIRTSPALLKELFYGGTTSPGVARAVYFIDPSLLAVSLFTWFRIEELRRKSR